MEEINQSLSIILFVLFLINSLLKSNDRFLIILTNAMNGLGIIYYAFGGELYKKPSDLAIFYMLVISITINIAYILYVKYFSKIHITNTNNQNIVLSNNKKTMYILLIYFLIPLYYFIVFFNGFPIYYMILGEAVGEGFRPDINGSLPNFYSFSVFLGSFTFPFLIQLYIIEHKKAIKLLIALFLLFFAMIMGDKSTLMVIVFYFVFIKGNISLKKIILFTLFFISFYMFVKYLYYQELKYEDSYALFESIFRRVSIIGSSTFGMYIDYFVISDGYIPEGFRHIKQFIFYLIYGYEQGGAPVYFPASFLNKTGIGVFQVFLTGSVFLLILILRNIVYKMKIEFFPEAIKYLHFYGALLLAQGFISDIFIRWFIPVICLIIFDKLLILTKQKYYKKKASVAN